MIGAMDGHAMDQGVRDGSKINLSKMNLGAIIATISCWYV